MQFSWVSAAEGPRFAALIRQVTETVKKLGPSDKFTKTVAGGKNFYHIDPVGFDESIQAYAVQIALPVYDASKAGGVMIVTLNLEKLEEGH